MSTIAAQLPDPTPPAPIQNLPPPSGHLLGVLPTTFAGDHSQSKKCHSKDMSGDASGI
ncbi:hypothetical protein B0F90DRAFT_1821956 [Multifurca ochricompacta]|uniref:Uncharacterized protein n=1 Tax=Multifurca ochricompacta TaxID=376703 RepID=A0AAD4QGL1_9AGAM|nr:hypothetical protein B0F90DRAFT_1821956 [Multifurca ochricompacta]